MFVFLVFITSGIEHNYVGSVMSIECPTVESQSHFLCRIAVGHQAELPTIAASQRQLEGQSTVDDIDPITWEDLADNRYKWQKACIIGVQYFEAVCIATAIEKRSRRKGFTGQSVPAVGLQIQDCSLAMTGRQFTARIGLVGHMNWR